MAHSAPCVRADQMAQLIHVERLDDTRQLGHVARVDRVPLSTELVRLIRVLRLLASCD